MNTSTAIDLDKLYKKRMKHIIFPTFLVSVVAFLNRINIAYAGMTMQQNLPWLNPEIFGIGAGMFFLGYPGSLIAAKFDVCKWIARIMISWGIVCGLMAIIQSPL